ncbi:MAG: YggS family pyridoxal phosphate-dependent enzyme [Betaproteobacteria bacterium]|nr:YggS family pyridoxal phosphate-dependent enzyme [Betaproteobacteria bacterium]
MRESSGIIEGLEERLQAVRAEVARAARTAGRAPDDIRIVAVSKTFPADAVRAVHAAGQRDFGESYVQEAVAKMDALADLDITWHFIGPIQSNKTRVIAERFAWVHSVDRLKIAERLAAQRPVALPPLQVCLQVNISGETTKSGVVPDDLAALARSVDGLGSLRLRGLMAIPEPTDDPRVQHARFAAVRALLDDLAGHGLALDTLSMGMSDDLPAAVAEGATMVRIGRAIFGARPPVP